MFLSLENADTIWAATKGLIGAPRPFGLHFKTRFGIHTFGLTFPIDVLILDKKNTVVVYKKNLKPCRFFFWQPKWDTVIELPSGTITKRRITIGTHIEF